MIQAEGHYGSWKLFDQQSLSATDSGVARKCKCVAEGEHNKT